MTDFFPPDVRLKVEGTYSEEVYGIARTQLFKTLQRADLEKVPNITTQVSLPDGTVVVASVAGTIKQIEIYRNPPPEVEPEFPEAEFTFGRLKPRAFPYMLSGWTKMADVTNGVLQTFRPTPNCALAYGLTQVFGGSRKLGTHSDDPLKWKFPSMFSGRMKRYVEAAQGLGEIQDQATGGVPFRRTIPVPYEYGWAKTHGIVRFADKKFWLVEVSKDNGVLARPLPLIPSTTLGGFRSRLLVRGDYDTVRVIDEFGGLPNGEAFPTGTDLTAALVAGTVKRLMTADELKPFYLDGLAFAYAYSSGWAFSENGVEAHNTCWTINDPFNNNVAVTNGHAHAPPDRYTGWDSHPDFYYAAYLLYRSKDDVNLNKYFDLVGSHWKIVFHLGDPTDPLVTPYATLELVHRGMFQRDLMASMHTPAYRAGLTVDTLEYNAGMGSFKYGDYVSSAQWIGEAYEWPGSPTYPYGVIVWVFYEGDDLIRVKWWMGWESLDYKTGMMPGFWTTEIDVRSQYVAPNISSTGLVISDFCREGYQIRQYEQPGTMIVHTKMAGFPPIVDQKSFHTPYIGMFRTSPNMIPASQVGFATNGAQTEYLIYAKYPWTRWDQRTWGNSGHELTPGGSNEFHSSYGVPSEVAALHPKYVNWVGSTP